jgi:hypothetical protein
MQRCSGRPTEAVRRIEAANGGKPVDRTRVYRALRKPTTFPARFAQLVVTASAGACTLFELIDLETVRERFEYTEPDLRRRALEYQILRAQKRRETHERDLVRVQAFIDSIDVELDGYRAQLDQLSAAADQRATG